MIKKRAMHIPQTERLDIHDRVTLSGEASTVTRIFT